ncbi:hypothetical protein FRC12_004162 [Ceratobasidium sp. 428]|nr:hypothetical protein FRC12_004162 [Ceratobasidium sp. 428]
MGTHQQMHAVVQSFPVLFIHNDLCIKHAVQSQHQDNQTVTDDGTAMSVIILPKSACPALENLEAIWELQSQFNSLHASAQTVSLFDILCTIHGFKKLKILASSLLHCLAGQHELASGPEHITKQFMPGTCLIDESSYSENIMVIQEFIQQLGLGSGEPLVNLALNRKVPWAGDELTMPLLRLLQWQRLEENNAYDRLDPFTILLGWLHLLMNLSSAMFEDCWGSMTGLGFAHITEILSCTGVSENMRNSCPHYHTVEELLMHTFEAVYSSTGSGLQRLNHLRSLNLGLKSF